MPDRLIHLHDDWFVWQQEPPLNEEVRVRVGADDTGRFVVSELHVAGPPTADLLRAIPVGRVEAAANAQLEIVGGELVVRTPRRRARASATVRADQKAGDEFYAEVARLYRDLSVSSRRPAIDLAEANDVPVTTAHRWIKEARRRGHLPPGRPGRPG